MSLRGDNCYFNYQLKLKENQLILYNTRGARLRKFKSLDLLIIVKRFASRDSRGLLSTICLSSLEDKGGGEGGLWGMAQPQLFSFDFPAI